MANAAQAFAGGFESGQAIGDTIVADRDLKQAQSESGPGADLFTTYQKAGQMAMQSGNTRVADKFLKQANEYKGEALKQHITELKVHQGEVEALYQDLQGSKTKEDLLGRVNKAAANGRLSEAEKLEYSGAINKLTDEQVPAFIEEAGKKTLGYKEQLDVQSKIAHDALETEKFKETKRHNIQTERNQAQNASRRETPADKRKADIATYQEKKLIDQIDRIDDDARKATQAIETKVAGKGYDSVKAEQEIKAIEAKRKIDKQFAQKNLDKFRKETDGGSDKPEPKATTSTDTPPPADHVKYLEQNPTTENKASFDKEYGPGSADKALKGAKTPAKESPKEQAIPTLIHPSNGSTMKPEDVKGYADRNTNGDIPAALDILKRRQGFTEKTSNSKKELTDEEQLAEDLSKATGVQERNAIRNDYNIRQDRKAKQAKQKAIAAKGKEKTEAAIAKAQKQGLVLSGMSGTQLKFVDPKTGKEVLESEL